MIETRFEYRMYPELPGLAWCLEYARGSNEIRVSHGPSVEIRDRWFCEGAWAGPFSEGGFDRAFMTGTGARISEGELLCVAPDHSLDRLLSIRKSNRLFVSNSLSFLLTAAGEELAADCPWYDGYWTSIKDGIRRHYPHLPTRSGNRAMLHYVTNLSVDRQLGLRPRPKPATPPFSDYRRYSSYLSDTAVAIATNARDGRRKIGYEPLTTVSAGYDSPTAAVIAKSAGCSNAITFRDSRGVSSQEDCGTPVAKRLDMQVTEFGRLDYCAFDDFPEAECSGGPNMFSSFGRALERKLLFTGYHGDKVWDRTTDKRNVDLVRGDASGGSVTELRLRTGFLHLPVPFVGARQLPSIVAISNSEDLRPWSVGGKYDRPIARRIVESAGVAREEFGRQKHAAGVVVSHEGLDVTMGRESYRDFQRYAGEHWTTGMQRSAGLAGWLRRLVIFNARVRNAVYKRTAAGPLPAIGIPVLIPRWARVRTYGYLGRESLLFHWGVGKMLARYRRALEPGRARVADDA